MSQRNAVSGGFFLTLFIIGGMIVGAARGSATAGAIVGTAIGAALTLIVYLVDRRRR